MDETQVFEEHRGRLRAVAYRMLGSLSEADDAVQETWLRLARTDVSEIENLGGWLTTVTGRICLNLLRSRTTRPELPLDTHVPDPIVRPDEGLGPEGEAMLADEVGLALLVVLDTLNPAERLAFVLHDMFAVAFDEIALIVDRSPAATRQLASRARRRVADAAPTPDADLARQREVVDAFFAASRDGDFDALLAVLDPDVLLRADGGPGRPALSMILRGGAEVAGQARIGGLLFPAIRRALINGLPGAVIAPRDEVVSIMSFVVRGGRIVEINVLADPHRLRALTFWFS
ncbi:sigma-70 family RNA polymerase sigma factor [Asanoa siamensis]|uniref:DNA-directed RNA polymerase sigma-70 factor n=1 Tax=Asanoa siamensis TaxID=926357 RepID=A0ABQ4D1G5_9ACTN|nr:sigma-70 family RNA polymerase sigma factor [Asanoa siamensis]GIF77390.1 DNA-directed RNA polymerase sigma-70 factor [Asanoa siamensis]